MGLRERFRPLMAPILERPVLIIESDDWGAGSAEQVRALEAIRELLKQYHDSEGRHPVMTLGVVLSVPDAKGIVTTGEYGARCLDEPEYALIRKAMLAGVEERVFDIQLHGLAHYWPANFMAAWRKEGNIRSWLVEDGWRTENLPPWLQSRWIDAIRLPSAPLPAAVIRQAVDEEIRCFQRCFGFLPKVAVPPTFVWNAEVEMAYAEAGIEVLMTPGRRYGGRDGEGRLTAPERHYHNGEILRCGLIALVRDVYFEPVRGHEPKTVLEAVAHKWWRGEPALLETHRFNFLGGCLESSLAALKALLAGALDADPALRFLSSHELATRMSDLSVSNPFSRIQTAWRRFGA